MCISMYISLQFCMFKLRNNNNNNYYYYNRNCLLSLFRISWAHSGYFENRIPLKPVLGRLCKNEFPIFILLCFFVSKGHLLDFTFRLYFTAAGGKCRVAAVKCLPVLHRRAVCVFISFGIIDPTLIILKIECHLSWC